MIGKLTDKLWILIVLLILETVVYLATLWFFITTPFGNETTYNAITIFWVSLMGFTLYLYGDVTKKPRFNTAGFAFMLFAVFMIIDKFEGFALKISAFAALLVAFAAFMSIGESRRLQNEYFNREIRDRTDRLYDAVLKWATDIFGVYTSLTQICVVLYDQEDRPFVDNEDDRIRELCNSRLLNNFQALRDEGKYIIKIAPKVSEIAGSSACELGELLTTLVNLLDNVRVGLQLGADIPSIVDIDTATDGIAPLCNTIIEETAKAKLRLTNVEYK